MKKIILPLVALAIILSSCSEQKFAFRKKIRVDANEAVIVKKASPLNEIAAKSKDELSNPLKKELLFEPHHAELVTPRTDKEIASTEKVAPLIVIPEWKQSVKTEKEKASPKENKKVQDDSRGFAIAGFILSIIGWFVLGILFCSLGVVFSILGLKSNKRGLAIAGLIIGILGVFLSLIFIAIAL